MEPNHAYKESKDGLISQRNFQKSRKQSNNHVELYLDLISPVTASFDSLSFAFPSAFSGVWDESFPESFEQFNTDAGLNCREENPEHVVLSRIDDPKCNPRDWNED